MHEHHRQRGSHGGLKHGRRVQVVAGRDEDGGDVRVGEHVPGVPGGVAEAEVLERVEENGGLVQPHLGEAVEHQVTELLLAERPVEEAEFVRDDRVEEYATRKGLQIVLNGDSGEPIQVLYRVDSVDITQDIIKLVAADTKDEDE